jgi:hypothetical protein
LPGIFWYVFRKFMNYSLVPGIRCILCLFIVKISKAWPSM